MNSSKKAKVDEKIAQLQIKSDQTERLLNKPYVNEVTLTGQNSPLKCCQPLESLNTKNLRSVDQRASKWLAVKL